MRPLVLLLFVLSSEFLYAQATSRNLPSEPPLATLTATPDRTVFELGEDIQVTLTLRAGPRGAYVSKWSTHTCTRPDFWCGRHVGNVSGFDLFVDTLTGKSALPMGHGGYADRFGPPPSPKEVFEQNFVFLQPGEQVKWRGSVGGSPTEPGDYEVIGAFIPDDDQLPDLAKLPEARGLLIVKAIKSPPVAISIR